jgi:hypothetical protein
MGPVRRFGLILALLCVAAAAAASVASARAHQEGTVHPCTAFGASWMKQYNADRGPIKIVAVCCALRSPKTGNSACRVMVTVRKGGSGAGTFGCVVSTVASNGNVLANRPLACKRTPSGVSLPS